MASWESGRRLAGGGGWGSVARYWLTAQHDASPWAPAAPPGPYHTPPSASQRCWWRKTWTHVFAAVTTQGGISTPVALMLLAVWVKLVVRMLSWCGSVRYGSIETESRIWDFGATLCASTLAISPNNS